MSTGTITLIIILAVIIIIFAVLYFLGKRMQKKQAEQQVQIDAAKQTVSMFIIDKKRLRLKEAGLPDMVMEQTPFYLRRSKVPILKVKIGPQITNLMCDSEIFDSVPVKKEVKASVSGIYVTDVRGLHGKSRDAAPVKKKGRLASAIEKLQEKAGAKPIK